MLLNFLDFSMFHGLISSLPAYLDPGSGSFILQVLIASLVGIGFTIRAYWGRIRKFFNKDSEDTIEEDLDETNE